MHSFMIAGLFTVQEFIASLLWPVIKSLSSQEKWTNARQEPPKCQKCDTQSNIKTPESEQFL